MTDRRVSNSCPGKDNTFQASRREFLLGTGATLVWLALPGCEDAGMRAMKSSYPRKRIGLVSELEVGASKAFTYPFDHPSALNFLIRLAEPAGGGVGPDRSLVAFNSFCTHQGGPLAGLFRANGIAGPCPLHWTTFDLTRHGMVVSGHATSGLPQIVLETEGDDILATGVLGLVYGHHDNREIPAGAST